MTILVDISKDTWKYLSVPDIDMTDQELSDRVEERIAMLKCAQIGDIVPGIGTRQSETVFIIHEN